MAASVAVAPPTTPLGPGAGGRRRKTAAERRAQLRRSEARAVARLVAGLAGLAGHRGGELGRAGALLRAALLAARDAGLPPQRTPYQRGKGVGTRRDPGETGGCGRAQGEPMAEAMGTGRGLPCEALVGGRRLRGRPGGSCRPAAPPLVASPAYAMAMAPRLAGRPLRMCSAVAGAPSMRPRLPDRWAGESGP